MLKFLTAGVSTTSYPGPVQSKGPGYEVGVSVQGNAHHLPAPTSPEFTWGGGGAFETIAVAAKNSRLTHVAYIYSIQLCTNPPPI